MTGVELAKTEVSAAEFHKLVAEYAYMLWDHGDPGTSLDHWLAGEGVVGETFQVVPTA